MNGRFWGTNVNYSAFCRKAGKSCFFRKIGSASFTFQILQFYIVMSNGKLYLIPTPLGEHALHTIPPYVISILQKVKVIIAERGKTARQFLKATEPERPLQDFVYHELNKRTPPQQWQTYLDAALQGQDVGLLSEAGCPGVADPGADIVALAYRKGIEVVPLVGPSSILLALMASGLNGQSFCFHGYLSPKKPTLAQDLKRLENLAQRHQQTQLFIETPYRNTALVEVALQNLAPCTHFCIAADLTLPTEYIQTKAIQDWQNSSLPDLHKRPAIFLLL